MGLLHRLDRPVSGVILIARTSKAAGRLSEQFRLGTIRKSYLAVVEGRVPEGRGVLEDRLLKDHRNNYVRVGRPGPNKGKAREPTMKLSSRRGRGRS